MALMYPIAADAIRSVLPGAWIVCETHSHPEPYHGPKRALGFGDGKPPWTGDVLPPSRKAKQSLFSGSATGS
jgi:hypothetical protein